MITPTLLYVEDEENDIFFLRRALKNAGAGAIMQTVSSGPDAIAYLSGAGCYADRVKYPLPAMILLDINLPGCSGFDVLAWVRGQRCYAHVPIIMFSSSARPEDLQKARQLGATDYLQKPASGLSFSHIAEQLLQCWMNAHMSSLDLPVPDKAGK